MKLEFDRIPQSYDGDSPNLPRVLVTGGAGFLGRYFVRHLLAQGIRIRILDDFSTGIRELLPADNRLEVIEGSVLDDATMAKASADVDLVLHLAAVVGMKHVQDTQDGGFAVSDTGTRNALRYSGEVPAVLISSSAVYGLATRKMSDDTEAISWDACLGYDGGRPGYACGKFMLEEHGRIAGATGRPVMILRPFNVVGPGQVSDYGMVLPRFIDQALAGLPLTIFGDGMQTRSFGHIRTFTDCVMRLINSQRAWDSGSNPINVGVHRCRDPRVCIRVF